MCGAVTIFLILSICVAWTTIATTSLLAVIHRLDHAPQFVRHLNCPATGVCRSQAPGTRARGHLGPQMLTACAKLSTVSS